MNSKIHKLFMSLIMLITLSISAYAVDFSTHGDAYYNVSLDYYVLTPEEQNKVGAIWAEEEIDLNCPFTINCEVWFGNIVTEPNCPNDTTYKSDEGADGICLVFMNPTQYNPTGQYGFSGGYLGYYNMPGFSHSFAVEMDTYNNDNCDGGVAYGYLNDGENDHYMYIRNGLFVDNSHPEFAEKHSMYGAYANVEQARWWDVKFAWNPMAKTVDFYFDNEWKGAVPIDLKSDVFPTINDLKWGFTSATGLATNWHKVRNVTVDLPTQANCPDCESLFDFGVNDHTYYRQIAIPWYNGEDPEQCCFSLMLPWEYDEIKCELYAFEVEYNGEIIYSHVDDDYHINPGIKDDDAYRNIIICVGKEEVGRIQYNFYTNPCDYLAKNVTCYLVEDLECNISCSDPDFPQAPEFEVRLEPAGDCCWEIVAVNESAYNIWMPELYFELRSGDPGNVNTIQRSYSWDNYGDGFRLYTSVPEYMNLPPNSTRTLGKFCVNEGETIVYDLYITNDKGEEPDNPDDDSRCKILSGELTCCNDDANCDNLIITPIRLEGDDCCFDFEFNWNSCADFEDLGITDYELYLFVGTDMDPLESLSPESQIDIDLNHIENSSIRGVCKTLPNSSEVKIRLVLKNSLGEVVCQQDVIGSCCDDEASCDDLNIRANKFNDDLCCFDFEFEWNSCANFADLGITQFEVYLFDENGMQPLEAISPESSIEIDLKYINSSIIRNVCRDVTNLDEVKIRVVFMNDAGEVVCEKDVIATCCNDDASCDDIEIIPTKQLEGSCCWDFDFAWNSCADFADLGIATMEVWQKEVILGNTYMKPLEEVSPESSVYFDPNDISQSYIKNVCSSDGTGMVNISILLRDAAGNLICDLGKTVTCCCDNLNIQFIKSPEPCCYNVYITLNSLFCQVPYSIDIHNEGNNAAYLYQPPAPVATVCDINGDGMVDVEVYANLGLDYCHSIHRFPCTYEKLAPTQEVDFGLGLSPNPSADEVTLKFDLKTTREYSIVIYDVNGNLVKGFSKQSATDRHVERKISIGEIASGSYQLVIITDDGISSINLTVTK